MTNSTAVAPYAQYLLAKRTVDDRSINAGVLTWLRNQAGTRARRFVEIGGGVGTMVARLYGLGIAVRGEYLLIDADARMLAEARRYLAGWAADHGVTARETIDGIALGDLSVTLVEAEIGEYSEGFADRQADVLIGCAVLDVIDAPRLVPGMLRMLGPGGLYWFPITYDGEMAFQPDHPADPALIAAYHADMDRRVRHGRPAGERFAGRHLLEHLRSAGAPVCAAGSADWIVRPGPGGRYPEGEAEFVAAILDTMESALTSKGGAPGDDRLILTGYLSSEKATISSGEQG
jgi:SAM-dependent methyltransferase